MADDDEENTEEDTIPGNRWCWIFPYIVALGLNIAMVVVGVMYDHQAYCHFEIVCDFLTIGGGVMLGFTILFLVSSMCCCSEEDRSGIFGCAAVIGIAKIITCCGLFIWACSPLFAAYGSWHYEPSLYDHDFDSEGNSILSGYCYYTPFMLAFVVLILYGIVLGGIACCFLFCCCACWYYICCSDDEVKENTNIEEGNTNQQPNTTSGAFSNPITNSSQHFQNQLQRFSSIEGWRKSTNNGNSSSIPPPSNAPQSWMISTQQPPTTQNYCPEVQLDMTPSAPPPPIQDALPPQDLPPPSYEEAIKT